LKDVPIEKRAARFRCVVALTPVLPQSAESSSPVCYADEHEIQTRCFEGTCEGRIGFTPRGHGGFGYDPLFIPDGYWQTFAELGESVKNQLSHRARALEKLSKALNLTQAKADWVIGT
jgi:XTP/dITP diphosphohydrolase